MKLATFFMVVFVGFFLGWFFGVWGILLSGVVGILAGLVWILAGLVWTLSKNEVIQ